MKEERIKIAKEMVEDGVSLAIITKYTELSAEEVGELGGRAERGVTERGGKF